MNRIVKAFIISLVISSFLVAGGVYLVQRAKRSTDFHSFLKNKPAPRNYTVHARLILPGTDDNRNAATINTLQKRFTSICDGVTLEKENDTTYALKADGITDSLLVSPLLTANSSLQWWELYDLGEFLPFLANADSLLNLSIKKTDSLKADTAGITTVDQLLKKHTAEQVDITGKDKNHPLYKLLNIDNFVSGKGSGTFPGQIGFISPADTPAINRYLENPIVKANIPSDACFLYGKPNMSDEEAASFIYLYAIKKRSSKPILDESFLISADIQLDGQRAENNILFIFNQAGSSRLEELTSVNVNKYIAIVNNNEVVTAAMVQSPIHTGSMELTNSQKSHHDIQLIYLLRKYGPLRTPVTIHQLEFSIQSPASFFKPRYLLIWLLVWAAFFPLILFILRASGRAPLAPPTSPPEITSV